MLYWSLWTSRQQFRDDEALFGTSPHNIAAAHIRIQVRRGANGVGTFVRQCSSYKFVVRRDSRVRSLIESTNGGALDKNASPWFVLVRDDEPSVRLSLTQFFEKAGYSLHSARSFDEALPSIAPDLRAAILDVVLVTSGSLSGLEVLTAIRENPAGTDVAVLMFTRRDSARRTQVS